MLILYEIPQFSFFITTRYFICIFILNIFTKRLNTNKRYFLQQMVEKLFAFKDFLYIVKDIKSP